MALDLGEVTLVDHKVVRLWAFCEGNGVELKRAPDYLRYLVSKERAEIDEAKNRMK